MKFPEESDVKHLKLIRKYLSLEVPDFSDKKFLILDKKNSKCIFVQDSDGPFQRPSQIFASWCLAVV